MAVCELSDDTAGAQSRVRDDLLRLQHQRAVAVRTLSLPASSRARAILARDADRPRRVVGDDVDRPARPTRPAADSAMTIVRWLLVLAIVCACQVAGEAHVGSPDVFLDASAGPYRLLVTIRTPPAIPRLGDME